MEENLYDEFGNYIGEEVCDEEEDDDEDWLGELVKTELEVKTEMSWR